MQVLRAIQRHAVRFSTLPPQERLLVLHAYISLLRTDIELRLHGYRQMVNSIEKSRSQRGEPAYYGNLSRAIYEARAIDLASRHHIVRARCLHRSITLHRWMCRRGVPCQLRIGVVKQQGQLKAHAWVEVNGQPIGDKPLDTAGFKVLRPPTPASQNDQSSCSPEHNVQARGNPIQWL